MTENDGNSPPVPDDSPQLTAEEIAARFGAKVRTVTGWMERHGFTEQAEDGRRDGRPVKLYRESILPRLAATVGKPLLPRSDSPQVGTGINDELVQAVIKAKDEQIRLLMEQLEREKEQGDRWRIAFEKEQEQTRNEQGLNLTRLIAATQSETVADSSDLQNTSTEPPHAPLTNEPSVPAPTMPNEASEGKKPWWRLW